MIGSRAWLALMRRNFLYRQRHWVATLLEMALPICFVGILVAIKNSLGDDTEAQTIPASLPKLDDVFTPMSFRDYTIALQAQRVCLAFDSDETLISGISGMPTNAMDWQVPFVRCDVTQCQVGGQDAQDFCEYSFLGLAPSSIEDVGGMERAQAFRIWLDQEYPILRNSTAMPFDFDFVQFFASQDDMEQYVQLENYGQDGVPKMALGIVFEGNDPQNYKYTLRQNATNFNIPMNEARPAAVTTPDTNRLFDEFAPTDESCPIYGGAPYLGPRQSSCTGQYLYNGILTIQKLVGDFILSDATSNGVQVADNGVRLVPFPVREYEEGGFFEDISVFVPVLLVLGLLYPVSNMISYICREKELRQKELMKMMSVTESDIGSAWFCSYLMVYLIIATGCMAVSLKLYENSSILLLWIFWALVFVSLVVLSMFISTFTSKTTRAVLIGLLIVFLGVFLPLAVDYQDGNLGTIGLLSLHPITAFSYGILEIGRLEDQGVGVTRDTVSRSSNPSGYTFSYAIACLIIDILLWGIGTWYLNRVIPPDFGQALPAYFPFMPSYWFPTILSHDPTPPEETDEQANAAAAAVLTHSKGHDDENNLASASAIPIEGVSDNLKDQFADNIIIRHLTKSFGEKLAVDNLSLTMFNGQVTALLGHNGAGKSTSIAMLTGALAPTSGDAIIGGKDLRTQLGAIRENIGICLQHDCLFPNMTVREHIQFFSRLKGLYSKMSHKEAEEQVDQIIKDVALFEKRNTFSKHLSGGMKRKLSVAIAFCGGSKVVLLDEPTSGMDPFSRRFTWNVIRQYRQNRCILLTTHFMDEADVLGDRIAIMAEGQLRCVGSPLFLKKHYGVGYQLTIEKQHKSLAASNEENETIRQNLDAQLMELVKGNVQDASLLNNVGSEVSFQLPVGAAAQFAPMFDGLDMQVETGAITSYGLSITTLEEVFLLVARGSELGEEKKAYASSRVSASGAVILDDATDKSSRSRMNLEQDNLFLTHVGALLRKRAANFRRDRKAWCCTTILPSIFVLAGLLIFKFAPDDRQLNPVSLTIEDYNEDVTTVPRNPITINNVQNAFTCQPGICSYQFGNEPFVLNETNEAYFYCGIHASVNNLDNSSQPLFNCSVDASTPFMNTINQAGVQTIVIDSTELTGASNELLELSDAYQASQYAAIYYTHDSGSAIVDDAFSSETTRSFSEISETNCTTNIQNFSATYNKIEECPAYTGLGYLIQYNFTAYHVGPTYMALATEGLARQALGTQDFRIESTIHPLPLTDFESTRVESEDAFLTWFLLVLSFPFIAGAFGTFIVAERESKAKHLQTVTGVKPAGYWVSTFIWDIVNYQFPMWITVVLFFAFGVEGFTTTENDVLSGVLVAMVLFGPAAAGFTYCMTYFFTSPALCNVTMIISGFLVGMGGPLTVIILTFIGSDISNPRPNLIDIAKIVTWVLRIHPCFCLGHALYFALNLDILAYIYGGKDTVWDGDILLYDIVFLAAESVLYLVLAIQLDIWSNNPRLGSIWKQFMYVLTCSIPRTPEDDITTALSEDSNVMEEEERVQMGRANDDAIVLDKLCKVYDNGKKAVNNLSLGIPPGQVFGLLGVNGAGKTTTMQMLTAEFPATSGDATLAGYSVSREPEKTRRRVGYCPQFDAHFANMTGREHVELYATIKGIPRAFVKEAAASKLDEVGLSQFDSDRLAANYSGGMKRRLSLACATIGDPQIVFLDECSTGVDPVARREIWELISKMVLARPGMEPSERTSVILTTHSMEECEALCPRIGIMTNGRLRALGSAQQLKNKFGKGYQIEMKCKLVDTKDKDYVEIVGRLGKDLLADSTAEEVYFHLHEVFVALNDLTHDSYLSDMINELNPLGYNIHKAASSEVGVSLAELAAFATIELRIRLLAEFLSERYSSCILRERQDTKVRYEVDSEGIKISTIFASIESNKDKLQLDDYGVSQTSLEQVFNMHAAEAEKLKFGTDDF